jgi:hypothetical protein
MLRECWPRVTSAMKELANALQTLSMLGACWPILGYAISLLANASTILSMLAHADARY